MTVCCHEQHDEGNDNNVQEAIEIMSKLADRLRGGRTIENKKTAPAEQYLTFMVAGEEYGVAILCVQEIRGWEPVKVIPNAPAYLRGVINLRGVVIPIVDLRVRFGLPAQDVSPTTVVVVLRVVSDLTEQRVGIVVDAVSEVYDIEVAMVHPAPTFELDEKNWFIAGIATLKSKMITLLSIERLLDLKGLAQMAS